MANKVTTSDLLKNPANFLYIFVTDGYLKYLSSDKSSVIKQKRANQIKYANTVCADNKVNFNTFKSDLSNKIKEVYGLTPNEILVKLALGYNVAGKNWAAGVFGVGDTGHVGYSNDTSITVDGTSGKILQNGVEVGGQTPIYDTYGSGKKKTTYISGYSATVDGNQYTSQVSGTTYKTDSPVYYSSSYSTSDGAFNYDGSAYEQTNASSIWSAIETYLPIIQKFFEWIASLFNTKLITANNTVPKQTEYTYSTGNSSNTDLLLIGGAAVVGAFLLMSGDGGKKKKKH